MAVTLYTDKATLARGGAPGAFPLGKVTAAAQDEAIADASKEADSYLRQRYVLPLLTYGRDLGMAVADIATWNLLRSREGDIQAIRLSYEDAIRWLKDVAAGRVSPDVTDSSPGAVEGPSSPRASVRGATSRGFTTISSQGSSGRNPFAGGWPDGRS